MNKKKPRSSKKALKLVDGFTCSFCKKVFVREKSLITHACRARKRVLDRDRKPNRIAYMAYREFYKANRREIPTVEHFEASQVYDAFLRFAKFVLDINAISPEDFVYFLIGKEVGIDRWCNPEFYNEYVVALTKLESWDRAIERNLLLMEQWAMQEDGREVINFFRDISNPLAVQYITSGRISPWTLLLCESGQALLSRLDEEQVILVNRTINFKFWKYKFQNEHKNVIYARAFLEQEGL